MATRILLGKHRTIVARQSPEQIKLQSNINRQASAARIDRETAYIKRCRAKLDGLDHKLAVVTEKGWSSWYDKMLALVCKVEQDYADGEFERAAQIERRLAEGVL